MSETEKKEKDKDFCKKLEDNISNNNSKQHEIIVQTLPILRQKIREDDYALMHQEPTGEAPLSNIIKYYSTIEKFKDLEKHLEKMRKKFDTKKCKKILNS